MSVSEQHYERQAGLRMAGAAALVMVYRAFGIECSQAELWKRLAEKDKWGRWCVRTQTVTKDALQHGLAALAIEARDPWLIFERCLKSSTQVIVNHRVGLESEVGHFSVLADMDEDHVYLHDPEVGPRWKWSKDELLRLWQPLGSRPEISRQVLVAIGPYSLVPSAPCPLCATVGPERFRCSNCDRVNDLQPKELFGCLADGCPMRAWEWIFCPSCDQAWDQGVPEAAPKRTPHPGVANQSESTETAIERRTEDRPVADGGRTPTEPQTGITRLPESP